MYSDESSQSTTGQTWLRGVQLTGSDGIAEFVTIYPGHYPGTTHIHVKVHVGGHTSARAYHGGHVSHTGQGGSRSRLKLTPLGSEVADGYVATITLVVDPAATPAGVGVGGD